MHFALVLGTVFGKVILLGDDSTVSTAFDRVTGGAIALVCLELVILGETVIREEVLTGVLLKSMRLEAREGASDCALRYELSSGVSKLVIGLESGI